ncbi:MAG: S41 family peptidase [Verrucomicrobiota bacterium]
MARRSKIQFDATRLRRDIPATASPAKLATADAPVNFMQLFRRNILGLLLTGLVIPSVMAAPATPLPKFEEIYQLLRTNGTVSETELNRAAVQGLLDQLHSQIVLVTNSAEGTGEFNLLSKSSVLDDSFAYLRVAKVESGLSDNLKSAYSKLISTNKLKGLILDLRYTAGTDYDAAAKTADLFIATEQPLLRWGEASARASTKTNAITFPVAVLVNHQTSGAAEALAAMLREAQVGLVLGTNTAGQASVFKEFKLADGQTLKVASWPVKLGNGKEIPTEGLKPDIEIALNSSDEKALYENPYRMLSKPALVSNSDTNSVTGNTDTNRPRRRLNEAELVRLQREGLSPDQEVVEKPTKEIDVSRPVLSDPALVRALDLLKGLAVVQRQAERKR